MPEREVAAAAAAATTAARDVRPRAADRGGGGGRSSASRAGAVSQQNTSPCGGTGSARGETEELKPAPSGAAVLPRPGAGGCSPRSWLLGRARPQAGRVRQRKRRQRGSRLVEDSAAAEVLSRPFQPDALAAALRCRCVGPRRGRWGPGAAAGLEGGALGRETQRGVTSRGRAGEGNGRRLCCWRLGFPLGAGKGREATPDRVWDFEKIVGSVKERVAKSAVDEAAGVGGGGRDGRSIGKVLGPPCREVSFHLLLFAL